MKDTIGYMDVRDRGVFTTSKTPIYYFTLDKIPMGLSVVANRVNMDEDEFKKMMKLFGAKKYGTNLVFKSIDSIEDALCWLKMIVK